MSHIFHNASTVVAWFDGLPRTTQAAKLLAELRGLRERHKLWERILYRHYLKKGRADEWFVFINYSKCHDSAKCVIHEVAVAQTLQLIARGRLLD